MKKLAFCLFLSLFTQLFCLTFNCYSMSNEDNDIVKICLCMTVKNAAPIIGECLRSVQNITDYISISDMESTDETVAIIQGFMDETHIPGVIHSHKFKKPSYNETLSARRAQQTLEKAGFLLENTYLLFLDEDMILQINDNFNKDELLDDLYSIPHHLSGLSYYNLRLVRASLNLEKIGCFFSIWDIESKIEPKKLESLHIIDKPKSKHHKSSECEFESDTVILEKMLRDAPSTGRDQFCAYNLE